MVTYFVSMFTFMSLCIIGIMLIGWLCCNCHNLHANDSSHDAHDNWDMWLIVHCMEIFANGATHHWIRPPKTCQELGSKRGLTFMIVCVHYCLVQHVHIKGFANFLECLQPQQYMACTFWTNFSGQNVWNSLAIITRVHN
jgi:hypothetical protein